MPTRTEIPVHLINPEDGNSIVGATVRIRSRASGSDAVVYASEVGAEAMPNPQTSDQFGRVNGWLDEGRYLASITGAGMYPTEEPFDSTPADVLPAGAIITWPSTQVPPGYYLCDGSLVSVTTNPKLAQILPTQTGSVVLPDLRGRFVLGAGPGRPLRSRAGADTVALNENQLPAHLHAAAGYTDGQGGHSHGGATGGEGAPDHTHLFGQWVPSSTHGWSPAFFSLSSAGGNRWSAFSGGSISGSGMSQTGGSDRGLEHAHSIVWDGNHGHNLTIWTGNAGANGAHENMPSYEALNSLIRAG